MTSSSVFGRREHWRGELCLHEATQIGARDEIKLAAEGTAENRET
jgi:hypothetical protein